MNLDMAVVVFLFLITFISIDMYCLTIPHATLTHLSSGQ